MYADFESGRPHALYDVSPSGELLRTCSCGQRVVVRDLVPIGLMDDGDGGILMLANHVPGCGTTLAVEVKS